MTRTVVIGAGINGLLTAWYLRTEGHEVTVLEEQAGPGLGASHANGAQLSYSYVAPLAGPGVVPKIPPWLFRHDSPLRLRPQFDWHQWRWILQFLLACNRRQSEDTTRKLLQLAYYSRDLMKQFLATQTGHGLEFSHRMSGKLVIYSSAGSFAAGRRLVDFQRALGSQQEVLGPDACMAMEPALARSAAGLGRRIVGAVFTPSEEVGDCYAFCAGLEKALHGMGVGFRYGFRVRSLEKRKYGGGLEVACASDGAEAVEADRFVLASGAASARLAGPLGIRLPIYPLQGYSISIPARDDLPTISVTDFDRKVVYAHLCAKDERSLPMLRVAGLVDLAGHDTSIDAARLKVLLSEVARAFPAAEKNGLLDVDNIRPWAGLRPATPRGTPLLGATRARNLYLNTGHGALGWTLAHASAKIVSDVIVGRQPELPVGPFQVQ